MKRIFLYTGILAGILLILVFVLTLFMDRIIQTNMESMGSEMLGTTMTVENVSISIFTGRGSITGITISNPEGFDEENALTIRSVDIDMDPWSIFGDTVKVREIDVQSLDATYELQAGRSNLGALRRNLSAYSETREPMELDMVIDRLVMEETTLTVRAALGDLEPATITLPRIEHTGIGRDEEADMNAVIATVLDIIIRQATDESLEGLIREGGRQLLEDAEDAIRDLLRN